MSRSKTLKFILAFLVINIKCSTLPIFKAESGKIITFVAIDRGNRLNDGIFSTSERIHSSSSQ